MEALAGLRVGLTPATMEDLAAIRLLVVSVSRRVKAAAKAAGPGDDFSGDFGCVGLVHRMAGKRAPDPRTHLSGPLEDSRSLCAPFRHRKQYDCIDDGIRQGAN